MANIEKISLSGTSYDVRDASAAHALTDIAQAGTNITFGSSEQQNFTIQGSPTITDKVVSNFNKSNFLSPTIPTPIFTTAPSWELGFKVTTGSFTDRNNLFQFCVGLTESTRYALAIFIELQGGVPYFGINSTYNGTAFDVGSLGQHAVLPNSQYYIRVGWTGTEYYVDYSLDGDSFTRDISIQSTTPTYSGLQYASIGVQYMPWAYTPTRWPWQGSVDLNECYIKANNVIVWTPYTDSIPTINATDTTYSAFTGADGVNAGTAGLVPAPTATDNTKFLKGDGTWSTVDSLPSQTGQAGKVLTTDGTNASWATLESASYDSTTQTITL